MSLEAKILALLHEKIGFDPASVGEASILAAIQTTLASRRIDDPEAYLEALRLGNKEFDEIVNAVTIPETWFFRDVAPFELLKTHVMNEWRPANSGGKLRCLSLPTSTGEEPYSIAMTLFDSGLEAGGFSIDGIDINTGALQRARAGIYGNNSFRAKDLSFRDRFFVKTDALYKLRDFVRASVNFSYGNLLDPAFMNDGRTYDIIFCRNLLIYFDAAGWEIALKTLTRLLKDSGLLFMGHAETVSLNYPQFESVRVPCSFAYRLKKTPPTAPAPAWTPGSSGSRIPSIGGNSGTRLPSIAMPGNSGSRIPSVVAPGNSGSRVPSVGPRPLPNTLPQPAASTQPAASRDTGAFRLPTLLKPPTAAPPEPGKSLDRAGVLADSGKFAEAAAECERYLKDHPGSAHAYFLLGLIRVGQGNNVEAENFFNKAIYLDSKHYQALIHLALLREGRGDRDGGTALRRRADRAKPNHE